MLLIKIVKAIIDLCLICVGLLGHLTFIVMFIGERRLRTNAMYYLLNLSLCDLFGLLNMTHIFVGLFSPNQQTPIPHFLCKFFGFNISLSFLTSISALILISFHRLTATVRFNCWKKNNQVINHPTHRTNQNIKKSPVVYLRTSFVIILLSWLLCIICIIPIWTPIANLQYFPQTRICELNFNANFAFSASLLVLYGFVSNIILFTVNLIIFVKVRQSRRRLTVGPIEVRKKSELLLFKQLITLQLVFFISWFPGTILNFIDPTKTKVNENVYLITTSLVLLSWTADPIIYLKFNTQLKTILKKYFKNRLNLTTRRINVAYVTSATVIRSPVKSI